MAHAQETPADTWHGRMVLRHRTAELDLEDYVDPDRVFVSVFTKVPALFEMRRDHGRWQRIRFASGTVCCNGHNVGIPGMKTRGDGEAVNLAVSVRWLGGNVLSRPLAGLRELRLGMPDPVLAQMVMDVEQDHLLGCPRGQEYSEYLFLATFLRAAALCSANENRVSVPSDMARAQRAVDYMHANLDERLLLHDLAAAAGHEGSLDTFVRLFKRHYGKAPHRYVLDLRLERAKEMFSHGSGSVTEVALACGFGNLSHFSDAFRRRWGVPPSALLRAGRSRSSFEH